MQALPGTDQFRAGGDGKEWQRLIGSQHPDRDNESLVKRILALRAERARLLGHPDFAEYRLVDSMARTPEAAEGLLRDAWEPAKRRAAEERAELEALARARTVDGPMEITRQMSVDRVRLQLN